MEENMKIDALKVQIPGIDPEKGIQNAGGPSLFLELLGDVHGIIDDKCELIEKLITDKDAKGFITQVHALKTTCRMIGAMEMAEEFFSLEKMGSGGSSIEELSSSSAPVLDAFRALKPYLEPYVVPKDAPDKDFDKEAVIEILDKLSASISDFNLSEAEDQMKALSSYRFDEKTKPLVDKLEELVDNLDYDEAIQKANELKAIISQT